MMIGDFYRNYGYPFVDPSHGGTIRGVLSAIDQTLTLAGPNTILAPGHGSLISRDRLDDYRKMIADTIEKVQAQINDGKTLKQVLAAKLTAPYDASIAGGLDVLPAGLGTSADRFVGEIFAELSGNAG
jgi:cyclase